MSAENYLRLLLQHLRIYLIPLQTTLPEPDQVVRLAADHGWDLSRLTLSESDIERGFGLDALFESLRTDAGAETTDSSRGREDVRILLERLSGPSEAVLATLPAPLNQTEFWRSMSEEIPQWLLIEYLRSTWSIPYAALRILGIIDSQAVTVAGPDRVPFVRRALYWDRMGRMFEPGRLLADVYGWGSSSGLNHRAIVAALADALDAVGLDTNVALPGATVLDRYYAPASTWRTTAASVNTILYTVRGAGGLSSAEFGLSVLPIPAQGDLTGPPRGLALSPFFSGELEVARLGDLAFSVLASIGDDGSFSLQLWPTSVAVAASVPNPSFGLRIQYHPSDPIILLGAGGWHRLEIDKLDLLFEVRLGEEPEVIVSLACQKIRAVIAFDEGDGFLKDAFGDQPQVAEADLVLEWSSRSGFRVRGGGALEVSIPINITIGVVRLDSLNVGLQGTGAGIGLAVGISGGLAIGPVVASVENVGVLLSVRPSSGSGGSFGNADIGVSFKPPRGIGLAVDAGAVAGGGFLSFDPEHGRYSGALQIDISGTIAVRAIGLLQTPLPGRTDGYSLIIVLSAEFPAIQIGMGLTLNGVGGLAGMHRTVNPRALQDGIRDGTARNLLFPVDPVRDAPRILGAIERMFPVAEGRYVFGPMVKLGYTAFITAEVGIFLEVPAPIRIILLGKIAAFLPDPDAATILLNIDILGILDIGAKSLSVDGTLHDSQIVTFPISGDLALRWTWGDDPVFVFALGGFHPHFPPPPNFPTLRRLALSILQDNEYLTLQLNAYFAITPNSLQFGAGALVSLGVAGFQLRGVFGFDAIMNFTPFTFRADFTATLAARFGGVNIAAVGVVATLDGPKPWHLHGSAYVSAMMSEARIPFEFTWGEPDPDVAAAVSAWDAVRAEITRAENWSAELPPSAQRVVSLVMRPGALPQQLLDPVGGLTLRQRAAPLNRKIDLFGGSPVVGPDQFDLEGVQIGSLAIPRDRWRMVQDRFARGQFDTLTEQEKLSRPSFERMDAGVTIAADRIEVGASVPKRFEFDTIAPPDDELARYTLGETQQFADLRRSAAGTALLRATGLSKFAPAATDPSLVTVHDETYVIARMEDLKVRRDLTSRGLTQTEANRALDEYLAMHPGDRVALQVVPAHEASAAA